jgi:hypothetical protein
MPLAAASHAVSSVEIRLGPQVPSCVLDTSLALRPFGLLLALRLAQEWRVWLTRGLWPLVDSCRLFEAKPELIGAGESPERVEPLLEALRDWHHAWLGARIGGRFFWIGDHRHESALPDDADERLPDRFERLAEALMGLDDDGASADGWSWRRDCAREALALAGALCVRPTIVLTELEDGESEPRIVRLWREGGRPAAALSPEGAAPIALPPHARVGLPPLLEGRRRLAAVHVAAPRAASAAWAAEDEPWLEDGGALDPWAGAALAWHALT